MEMRIHDQLCEFMWPRNQLNYIEMFIDVFAMESTPPSLFYHFYL